MNNGQVFERRGQPTRRTGQVIIYGAGLIAHELFRLLSQGKSRGKVCCFAVTSTAGQPSEISGLRVLPIEDAVAQYPGASICLGMQEKHHRAARETLRAIGRTETEAFGLQRMTAILKARGIAQLRQSFPHWQVTGDAHDRTMIAWHARETPGKVFKLYPMTQIPLSKNDLQCIGHTVEEGFEASFGPYRCTGAIPSRCPRTAGARKPSLFVGMACSPVDAALAGRRSLPGYVHPVQAGAALGICAQKPGVLRDDEGENISARNGLYSELSVTYWAWKNATADYLGICHYRRLFVLGRENWALLENGQADAILTRPRLTLPDVRTYFTELPVTSMMPGDYARMMGAIRQDDASLAARAEELFRQQIHLPNNMVIARREIFSDYCQWMFRILLAMEKEGQRHGMAPRSLGYAGELLTTLYFADHHEDFSIRYVDYELLF